ncbi:hypothetical protein SBRY_10934 [Actinacidiphila bryophytorum]|uniref:Uncharacterized protein n=1 Tax=Actinacidiphila bryophytorum TaxID=1436133 RepID=A0A9W4GZ30_9ACTN|nr:hypothetical protein SBRY_10934 [Actinacidiphila bryophytorum]
MARLRRRAGLHHVVDRHRTRRRDHQDRLTLAGHLLLRAAAAWPKATGRGPQREPHHPFAVPVTRDRRTRTCVLASGSSAPADPSPPPAWSAPSRCAQD